MISKLAVPWALAGALLCAPLMVHAQPGVSLATGQGPAGAQDTSTSTQRPVITTLIGRDTGSGLYCILGSTLSCSLPAADPNNAPYLGERALTVGVPDPLGPGRSLKANCTATGNVSVTYADGSTSVWMVATTGTHIFGAEVIEVNASGTTATCAFGNLK